MADDLPDDILVDLLGRLSPRDQALSRCVCKAWRGIIDGRRLLRADLLPLTLRGIFLMDDDYVFPPFFSRPSPGPAICDNLDDCITANNMRRVDFHGHCNGLLLFWGLVVNPATGRWARFPLPPPSPPPLPLLLEDGRDYFHYEPFLAFDPTVSPYYEVFLIPEVPAREGTLLNPESEWPPSPFVLRVFSSRTRQWEERLFERETRSVLTMGTVAGIQEQEKRLIAEATFRYSAFYRGRLYVQCQNNFAMRINTSSGTYHLVKRPMASRDHQFYLGKSKDGVYSASVDSDCWLQVWYLDEAHGQLKWALKCDTCLMSLLRPRRSYHALVNNGPWFLRCYGDNEEDTHVEGKQIAAPNKLEWSSDMEVEDIPFEDGPRHNYEHLELLGFHPYKEVVFLHQSCYRGIAYHLNCSKIQDMGTIDYRCNGTGRVEMSFPYTPCWTGNL